MSNLDYLTREFVRKDCGSNGAVLSEIDCDLVIQEVKRLYDKGEFHHTGVYWVANKLAGEGVIKPELITGLYGYISDEQIQAGIRRINNE